MKTTRPSSEVTGARKLNGLMVFVVVGMVGFWFGLLVSLASVAGDGGRIRTKLDQMQQKKNDFRFFLERTDALAHTLRIPLRELGAIMGMSTASLFGYRSGKIPLSNKAWGKLEAAEKTVGIAPGREDTLPENSLTRESVSPPVPDLTKKVNEMDEKLDRLIAVIADQAERIDALLEQRATSSPGRGRAVGSKREKLS